MWVLSALRQEWSVICTDCQQEIHTGSWPWCPHGVSQYSAVGDDIPGGFVQEHFGDQPETFYSKKAMLARADELNLRLRDQWAGPGDRHLSNWASVSAKTLADAKILLERVGAADAPRATLETLHFTVRDVCRTSR
jgi:hypothetical protein